MNTIYNFQFILLSILASKRFKIFRKKVTFACFSFGPSIFFNIQVSYCRGWDVENVGWDFENCVWASILGPILFILYINGLCKVSEILKFVLFADDTNLFASGSDLKQLCDAINCSFTFLRMSSMIKTIFLHGWNLDQRILNETI